MVTPTSWAYRTVGRGADIISMVSTHEAISWWYPPTTTQSGACSPMMPGRSLAVSDEWMTRYAGTGVPGRMGGVEGRLLGEHRDGVPSTDELLDEEVGGELRAPDGGQVRLRDEQNAHRA